MTISFIWNEISSKFHNRRWHIQTCEFIAPPGRYSILIRSIFFIFIIHTVIITVFLLTSSSVTITNYRTDKLSRSERLRQRPELFGEKKTVDFAELFEAFGKNARIGPPAGRHIRIGKIDLVSSFVCVIKSKENVVGWTTRKLSVLTRRL